MQTWLTSICPPVQGHTVECSLVERRWCTLWAEYWVVRPLALKHVVMLISLTILFSFYGKCRLLEEWFKLVHNSTLIHWNGHKDTPVESNRKSTPLENLTTFNELNLQMIYSYTKIGKESVCDWQTADFCVLLMTNQRLALAIPCSSSRERTKTKRG